MADVANPTPMVHDERMLVDARFFCCFSGEGSWVRNSLAHTWNLCPGLVLRGEGVPLPAKPDRDKGSKYEPSCSAPRNPLLKNSRKIGHLPTSFRHAPLA